MLDLMGLGLEAVVVLHVGGLYNDKAAAMNRFVQRYHGLAKETQQRLALENDERAYTVGDALAVWADYYSCY